MNTPVAVLAVLAGSTILAAAGVIVAYLLARPDPPAPPVPAEPILTPEVQALYQITRDLLELHRAVVTPQPQQMFIPDPFDDNAAAAALDLLHDPSPDPAEFGPLGELEYDPAYHDQPGLVVDIDPVSEDYPRRSVSRGRYRP